MPREAIEYANLQREPLETAMRGTSLFQEETGHFIRKNAYRSCHDINTVKKLHEDVPHRLQKDMLENIKIVDQLNESNLRHVGHVVLSFHVLKPLVRN